MISLLFRIRWILVSGYWLWLTFELLLNDPWILYGEAVALEPPVDTSAPLSSFVLHMGSYGLLAGLLFLASINKGIRSVRWWMNTAFLYGIATELMQSFLPSRFPSWDDLFSNSLGIAVAYFCCAWISEKGYFSLWYQEEEPAIPMAKAA